MNGMLPNQEISRLLAQDREREVRDHVERRSLSAITRVARRDEKVTAEARRSRLARLATVHSGHAVRTVAGTVTPASLLVILVMAGSIG